MSKGNSLKTGLLSPPKAGKDEFLEVALKEKLILIKRIIWYSIVVISASTFIVLSSGFIKAMKVTYDARIALNKKNDDVAKITPASSIPDRKNANSIKITIMGDSIAKGAGDEKGKGLSGYIPFYFRNQTSKEIWIENVGVEGLRSEGLLEQLQSGKLNKLIAGSDYIVISIGGNDAREILSLKGISKEDEFNNILDEYLINLKDTLKIIRENNPLCIIILIGLYNPYQNENHDDNSRLLNNWNYRTGQLLEDDGKALSIPTHELFKFNIDKFIAADGLHPNSAGYRTISDLICKSVESFLIKEK